MDKIIGTGRGLPATLASKTCPGVVLEEENDRNFWSIEWRVHVKGWKTES